MTNVAHRRFADLCKSHDLTLERRSKHYGILRSGKLVATLTHSATDTNTYRETVRTLVRLGALPVEAKRVKF